MKQGYFLMWTAISPFYNSMGDERGAYAYYFNKARGYLLFFKRLEG